MKTGILLICVGQYDQFLHPMLDSIEKFWTHDKEIFLFTDKPSKYLDQEGVTVFGIPFQKFPSCSMFRYHYFNQVKDYFDVDYLYYVDVDARFVDYVGDEIIGDLVAVQHCGFVNKEGTFEERQQSQFYVAPVERKTYFGGGFQGGETSWYMQASQILAAKIDKDIKNDIIPVHHDESAWNWYCNKHLNTGGQITQLSPEYHYPENDEYFSLNCWNGEYPYKPKLLLLEKDHASIR